jgi:predicted enzyme related to lactoylglutathione lyase
VQTATGKFVWHDNMSTDVDKAKTFYADLFGWDYEIFKPGEWDYAMLKANGQTHGGFGAARGGAPSHWLGSVLVEDVDATIERAKKAGGSVLSEPMDIPDIGRLAVIADPQGAAIAVFSSAGDEPTNEGTFVWDELMTTDVDGAKKFYGEVFGWTSRDMSMGDMGTYSMFMRAGDTDVGGLMQRPPGMENVPPNWTSYIGSKDVDATAAHAKELGGTVMREPTDVPGQGRFAIVVDPAGAVFGAWQATT